mmetsp:Transcript_33355/g.76101  ORF Transcript_33355/g.76101 Transcript_33355/m.76101 type:complete len:112 (-) Transcript_33355:720-1055(-)
MAEPDAPKGEATKVTPSESEVKASEEKKEVKPPEEKKAAATVTTPVDRDAPLHVLIIMGILIAVLGTFAQQTDLISGNKSPERWVREIFEPHVVPPPDAETNQVVIQFCQS